MFVKVSVLLDFSTVLSKEFAVVDDDIMYVKPQIWQIKTFVEFVQSSKNIVITDSDDEYEMNNAATVPMSSEMRNIMKIMRSYFDVCSDGKMNNKMDDIGQFVDNMMLKRQCEEKYQIIFVKLNKSIVFFKKNLKILYI
ncbi:hypothetical protein TNCV_265361 [Trichonephila clavipes]|nr:hypothetical protein TNCV_265361 [Trichonephila clavipes]